LLGGEVRDGERAGACLRALIGRPLIPTLRTSGPRPGPSGRLAPRESFAGARRGPRRRASRVRPRALGPRRTPHRPHRAVPQSPRTAPGSGPLRSAPLFSS